MSLAFLSPFPSVAPPSGAAVGDRPPAFWSVSPEPLGVAVTRQGRRHQPALPAWPSLPAAGRIESVADWFAELPAWPSDESQPDQNLGVLPGMADSAASLSDNKTSSCKLDCQAPQEACSPGQLPVVDAATSAADEGDEVQASAVCEATAVGVVEPGAGRDQDLEPLLRATIRRALAEHRPSSSIFRAPGLMRKLGWHVEALFSCRYYEDIAFERTHRFQVEEAFLLRTDSLAMVGYASKEAARQVAPWRVETSVGEIAEQLRDLAGEPPPVLKLSAERKALIGVGSRVLLVAVTRGTANPMHLADLEFVLRRIEHRFRDRLAVDSTDVSDELRPFLEDCLLIQAPVG